MDWPTIADLVDHGPWWHNRGGALIGCNFNQRLIKGLPGIVMLNICLALAVLTSYTNVSILPATRQSRTQSHSILSRASTGA